MAASLFFISSSFVYFSLIDQCHFLSPMLSTSLFVPRGFQCFEVYEKKRYSLSFSDSLWYGMMIEINGHFFSFW